MEKQYDFSLKDHIEAITLVIITITTIPVIYKLFFAKKKVIPSDTDTTDTN
jgi:membrane-associated protein